MPNKPLTIKILLASFVMNLLFLTSVSAQNSAPVIFAEDLHTVQGVPIDGWAAATDADGDALTYSISKTPSFVANTVTIDAQTGGYTFTPYSTFLGQDSLEIAVSDGKGGADSIMVYVNVYKLNYAPTANLDSFEVKQNKPTALAVLDNDTDVDGSPDPTTITIELDPLHGTVSVDFNTGEIIYTSDADFLGEDSLVYKVFDDGYPYLESDTAVVYITVVAASVTVPEGFSPNGDGVNDNFEIANLERFPNNHLQIINRWGNLVYDAEPYNNNWDGEDLPVGTYFYVLDLGNDKETVKGFVYLNR